VLAGRCGGTEDRGRARARAGVEDRGPSSCWCSCAAVARASCLAERYGWDGPCSRWPDPQPGSILARARAGAAARAAAGLDRGPCPWPGLVRLRHGGPCSCRPGARARAGRIRGRARSWTTPVAHACAGRPVRPDRGACSGQCWYGGATVGPRSCSRSAARSPPASQLTTAQSLDVEILLRHGSDRLGAGTGWAFWRPWPGLRSTGRP